LLHLISLNKYIVALIVNQGNSCPIYFMVVSLFSCLSIAVGFTSSYNGSGQIIPLLEKILLLVRYNYRCNNSDNSLNIQFVVSSIMGLKGCRSVGFKGANILPFSLRVLSHI